MARDGKEPGIKFCLAVVLLAPFHQAVEQLRVAPTQTAGNLNVFSKRPLHRGICCCYIHSTVNTTECKQKSHPFACRQIVDSRVVYFSLPAAWEGISIPRLARRT